MGEPRLERMTVDAFLAWDLDQGESRHELVDGIPQAMTGASSRHDQIVVNVIAELRTRLRGGRCRAATADSGIRIPNGNLRRPDAAVDCGPRRPEDLVLAEPRLVVEVLSRSTRLLDHHRKMEDYKQLPTLATDLIIYQEMPRVTALRRQADGTWRLEEYVGFETVVALPDLGIELPLADLYDGVEIDLAE